MATNTKQHNTVITPDQSIKLSIKEFLGLCLFLLSLGISIGGFIKVVGDIKDLSTKVEKVSDKIEKVNENNIKLETIINSLPEKDKH